MKDLPQKTLYTLVGPPGCGKSVAAWDLVNRGALRITGDDLFFAITFRTHGEWRPYGVMDAVNKAMDVLLEELLIKGLTVVVDRTHLSPKSRARVLELAKTYGYRSEAWVWLNADQAQSRNAARTGRDQVPPEIWLKMVEAFRMPTLSEGFHAVRVMADRHGRLLMDSDGPVIQKK